MEIIHQKENHKVCIPQYNLSFSFIIINHSSNDKFKDEPRVVIDLEYERQQQSYKMNDAVKSFITHFYRAIQNAKIFEITHDYEYGYLLLYHLHI